MYTINSEYALVIKSVEIDDYGKYFCRAQNSEGFGRDSIPFYVDIKGMNFIFIKNMFCKKKRNYRTN
jgi:hypothetical protein